MKPANIPVSPATTQSRLLYGAEGRLVRVSLRESTETFPAVVRLWDGDSDKGVLIDSISLSPAQSTRDYYKMYQHPFYGGLFMEIVNGEVEGSFTIVLQAEWPHYGEPIVMVNPDVLALTLAGSS